MPAAPRTDPYTKHYLIRLLPRVEREVGDWNTGGESEDGGDDVEQDGASAFVIQL